MNIKTTNAQSKQTKIFVCFLHFQANLRLRLGYPLMSLKSNLKTSGHSHRQAKDRLGHSRGETDRQTAGSEKERDRLKTDRETVGERERRAEDRLEHSRGETDRQLGERQRLKTDRETVGERERQRQAEDKQGERERQTGSRQTGRWWETERQRQAEDKQGDSTEGETDR